MISLWKQMKGRSPMPFHKASLLRVDDDGVDDYGPIRRLMTAILA
jgi:hypothetical protein